MASNNGHVHNLNGSPEVTQSERLDYLDELLFVPPTVDERERVARWKDTTELQRAETFDGLARLAEAIGYPKPQRAMFPGFPQHRETAEDSTQLR